ncbi:hypothetical protein [Bacillus sp. FJAT-27245]|uniref:hypothetical protein n=1 Tax=Bacillus sp. FJAT-27245 TaxID=1684144 RepID=UPI0006A75E04|nr:hypothetical protein [Bacillus sp. FJAT-27245]
MKRNMTNFAGIILIILLLIGLLANHFYFQPKKELAAAKEKMLEQLSEKYGKEFEVSEITYGKALGDREGAYTSSVYPKGNKHLTFQVHVAENGKIIDESFKETKWRSEAIKSWEPFMSKFGRVSYAVNISIPEDIRSQYDLEDTYEQIYEKHKHAMSEYVFIGEVEKSFDKKKESENVAEVANYALQRGLHDFSIEWLFFNKGKQDADVFKMKKNIPSYSWRLSKEALPENVTGDDLDKFIMQH